MLDKPRKRIHEILEVASAGDRPSRAFDVFIMSLISANVVAVILETVEHLSAQWLHVFQAFELFSVVVFSVEYVLRLWSCTANPRYGSPLLGRLRFALTFMVLVDLFAVLPFYLPMIITLDLRFVRALRLLRLFRLFKVGRYSDSLRTIGNVLRAKKEELLVTVFLMLLLLVVASSLVYFLESETQPEAFSSIPAAMWWGVATLTTIGYGDMCPMTPLGKLFGTVIAILGIGMFALPAGILASGFAEELRRRRGKAKACPHCGADIE
jgi:voltage-gated potassium channel